MRKQEQLFASRENSSRILRLHWRAKGYFAARVRNYYCCTDLSVSFSARLSLRLRSFALKSSMKLSNFLRSSLGFKLQAARCKMRNLSSKLHLTFAQVPFDGHENCRLSGVARALFNRQEARAARLHLSRAALVQENASEDEDEDDDANTVISASNKCNYDELFFCCSCFSSRAACFKVITTRSRPPSSSSNQIKSSAWRRARSNKPTFCGWCETATLDLCNESTEAARSSFAPAGRPTNHLSLLVSVNRSLACLLSSAHRLSAPKKLAKANKLACVCPTFSLSLIERSRLAFIS